MIDKTKTILIFTLLILATSCQAFANNAPQQQDQIASTTPSHESQLYSCADIETNWGNDWQTVIEVLDGLIAQDQICGDEPLSNKKYAAHFNYANVLETSGELDTAVDNYTSAFLLDANRTEALNALMRLNALPPPTAVSCNTTSAPLPDPAPLASPDRLSFVQTEGDKLISQGEVYEIRGVNYYPRSTPWHRFLLDADFSEVDTELALIKQAGFNTIRIFLWYEPLFDCQPEDAIPNEQTFDKVDRIIELAKKYDLKIIVTLNDLPDLIFRPLYTDWDHYDAQTIYIVRRYRNEAAIVAWDLRNEGDLDYGVRAGDEVKFQEEDVIGWLAHISHLVRSNDSNHLITTGWWGDPLNTEPFVDFLSFHHWYDTASLQERIDTYKQNSNKPLLLEEIGYHSWQDAPQDQRDEDTQAVLLENAVDLVEVEEIAGWMIWAAYDFVPELGQSPNFEHYFGVWRSDLTEKPALSSIFKN